MPQRSDFAENRRYGYPFTNCTNCGPRYTIIRDVPYDRPNTTMADFRMCARCQAEYEDPRDRRFHAEPNACPDCGPSLALLSAEELASGAEPAFGSAHESPAILARARQLLREGHILAIKGLGGFHLACNATDEHAVSLLRERKRGNGKAFAVMVSSMAAAERLCVLNDAERALLAGDRRPIVLLKRRETSPVPAAVAPGNAPASGPERLDGSGQIHSRQRCLRRISRTERFRLCQGMYQRDHAPVAAQPQCGLAAGDPPKPPPAGATWPIPPQLLALHRQAPPGSTTFTSGTGSMMRSRAASHGACRRNNSRSATSSPPATAAISSSSSIAFSIALRRQPVHAGRQIS